MFRRSSDLRRSLPLVELAVAGSVLALVMTQPVAAQESTAPADAIDEVVVAGSRPIAESQAIALELQRNSDSLVSVLAADSIGRLPDQNIAQATSRLPGVAVERDQGQARYINLRGSPNTWTTLSFDGINIVSPEGRSTRFDNVPSALASQVIVHKAVTPDMTGETIAGNVEVITRSALDYDGARVIGKAGIGQADYGDRREREGSLILSDRYDLSIGELGLLASGSYYEQGMITDNYETDWEQVSQDRQPGAAERVWGRETENKLYRLTRKNFSGTLRVDLRTSETSRIFLQSIATAFTDDEARDNYIFDLDDRQSDNTRPATPACTVAVPSVFPNSGYADTCVGNTPFAGTVLGVDINQRATLRAFRQSIFTNTLGGDHQGDTWKLGWRLNLTRAEDDRSVRLETRYDSPSTRTLRPTVRYDFTNPQLARVQLFRTVSVPGGFQAGEAIRDIDQFARPLSSARSLDAVDTTDAYTARVDLSRNTALFTGDTTLAFGLRLDSRTKEANESEINLTTAAQFQAAGIPTTFPVSALVGVPFAGRIPLGYSFSYYDVNKSREYLERMQAGNAYRPITANFYDVSEDIYAGYGMATIRYGWGNVVGGLRVEHIRNDGQAFVTLNGQSQLIGVGSDHTLLFPSLHVNVNLAEDKKLRLSLNSGAARADYGVLRPNFTFNDANLTVSGGNPQAKPERAYGADAYFEWYLPSQGFVMVGAYYKRVEDVLFSSTRTFGLDVLDAGGIDRSQYLFSAVLNGGKGYVYGAEAAFQHRLEPFTEALHLPSWTGGFGILANVTLNESEATTPTGEKVQFPGTSSVVYNVGPYYEKYGASIRLTYQKRTAWLDGLGAAADGGQQFWAPDEELDFSARYAFTPSFEMYIDGLNLTNQPGRRFVGNGAQTLEWERFGRRYAVGFRVTL
jgi:TonB-dependent receptor